MIEETLVLIKPDGVKHSLIGEIISRFEKAGLQIAGLKLVKPAEKQLNEHYLLSPEWVSGIAQKTREAFAKKGLSLNETDLQIAQRVQGWLKDSLGAGFVIAMVLRGNCAIEVVRKLVGATEPRTAAAGTIRGDLSADSYDFADLEKRSVGNLIHASSSLEEAKREIAIWFQKDVIYC